MYWNHRIMQRIDGKGTSYESIVLYVVEVYYNEEDSRIIGWTEKESVWGENIDEVRQSLHWMLDALDKPILIEADLFTQAEVMREAGLDTHDVGLQETFDNGILTLDEVLDSLGLERIDIEGWENDGGAL